MANSSDHHEKIDVFEFCYNSTLIDMNDVSISITRVTRPTFKYGKTPVFSCYICFNSEALEILVQYVMNYSC